MDDLEEVADVLDEHDSTGSIIIENKRVFVEFDSTVDKSTCRDIVREVNGELGLKDSMFADICSESEVTDSDETVVMYIETL